MTSLNYQAEHLDFRRSFATLCARSGADESALAATGEAGFLGMRVPEDLGGAGVDDPLFLAIGIEELCRVGRMGAALGYAVQAGVVLPALVAHADRDLTKEVVPGLADGSSCAAVLVSGVEATGTDDGWVLRGGSRTVINAAGARHLLVVFHDGTSQRVGLVAVDQRGVEVVERGTRALEGAGLAEIGLDDVRLRSSWVLASAAHQDVIASLRLWESVVALHGARHALDLTVAYVRDRKVFGRPLSRFDNTRAAIGGVTAALVQAQHSVEWGLLRSAHDGVTSIEAAPLVLAATQAFHDAADVGMQLHGGYGYMREYPISGTFADAQLLLLLGGATHPIADLAEGLLGTSGA